jgi:signal peptidase II
MERSLQSQENIWQKYRFLLAVAIPVIFVDQITKSLVRSNLALEETWVPWPWVDRFGRIVHWRNEGSAFDWFAWDRWLFILLALIGVVAIIYYFPRIPKQDWSFRLAMGLLLGGIVGNNLIDRILFGAVTDFIMISYYDVFNFADISNFAGVVVLVLGYLFEERKKKSTQ